MRLDWGKCPVEKKLGNDLGIEASRVVIWIRSQGDDYTVGGMELQWLLETILFVFVAFIVAGVILIAVLGWSLYRARRRIDMLAARAGTLETKLAPKMSSSRQNATPQTEGVLESGGEQDPAGPTRPEAARPFRFGNHPFLTVVLVIVLLGISILIPLLPLVAFLLLPAVLGVLRYRAQRRIRVLTARITSLEMKTAPGTSSSTPPAVALPSPPAEMEAATARPRGELEGMAESDWEPGPVGSAWTDRLHSFLFGGNTLVRIGIILLFFGFAFFLSYASEQGWFPIKLRLSAAAAAGVALLTIGWRLRDLRREYALALQGGGAGIAYLTAFAATNFYGLIGPGVGLGAMLVLVALTGALAVRQDAPSLALLSSLGGFLGPVLVTRDASHVALFSYYAVLDAGIVTVAWFRAWRLLSLLGFVFTFLVGAWWGAAFYQPQHFATTQPFLALFLALFVAVPVLHAWRQPLRLVGFVAGTLVFGVPLAAFTLQHRLASGSEDGPAVSAIAFCIFYAVVAVLVSDRGRGRESLRPLVESFAALSVIFGTLAIPLAADGHWIAVALALEGTAMVWISTRQNRRLFLLTGFAIQFLAGCIAISGNSWATVSVLEVGHLTVGLCGLVSAWCLRRCGVAGVNSRLVSVVALAWGSVWWYGGGVNQISWHLSSLDQNCAILGFLAISAATFTLMRTRLDWKDLAYPPLLLLPAMVLLTIRGLSMTPHLLTGWGLIAWPAVFLIQYWVLWRCETEWPRAALWYHCGTLWLGVFLVWREAVWISGQISPDPTWSFVMWALVPAYYLWGLMTFRTPLSWPVKRFRQIYLGIGQVPLVIAASGWVLVASFHPGGPDPQDYVPFLNPIEFVQLFSLGVLLQWSLAEGGRMSSKIRWRTLGFICFVTLNGVLARMACRFLEIPFEAGALLSSGEFQALLSVVWTTAALVLMLVATRTRRRPEWQIGAALLTVTVIKLLLFDLADTGTVTRIVSFIVVGGLILVVGYFSPLPPKDAGSNSD